MSDWLYRLWLRLTGRPTFEQKRAQYAAELDAMIEANRKRTMEEREAFIAAFGCQNVQHFDGGFSYDRKATVDE